MDTPVVNREYSRERIAANKIIDQFLHKYQEINNLTVSNHIELLEPLILETLHDLSGLIV